MKKLIFLLIIFAACNPTKVILKNTDLARSLVCDKPILGVIDSSYYVTNKEYVKIAEKYQRSADSTKKLIDSISKLMPFVDDLNVCKDYFRLVESDNKTLQNKISELTLKLQNTPTRVISKTLTNAVYKDMDSCVSVKSDLRTTIDKKNGKLKILFYIIIWLSIAILLLVGYLIRR